MEKKWYGFIVLMTLLCSVTVATAQVSISISSPNVRIGINVPVFPQLMVVPGYPVYYAPKLNANYFFYDGMYWVYQDDYWFASSWYNGPWDFVAPEYVPLFVLRIPVRYYRQPPAYFRGWKQNAPPRWGQHWGHGWERQRGGWDRWNRNATPTPAPLPIYQQQYSGERYPRQHQQEQLRSRHYRYQPHDTVARDHYKQPAQRDRQHPPQGNNHPGARNDDRHPPQGNNHPGARNDDRHPPQVINHPGVWNNDRQAPRVQGQAQNPQHGPNAQEQTRHNGQEQKNKDEQDKIRNEQQRDRRNY